MDYDGFLYVYKKIKFDDTSWIYVSIFNQVSSSIKINLIEVYNINL